MSNAEQNYTCSFCKTSRDKVGILIGEGDGPFICDDCVGTCNEVLADRSTGKGKRKVDETVPMPSVKLPTPKQIKAHLDTYIIGQDKAKEVVSVAVYNHYKRLSAATTKDNDIELEKSNILLLGPTGSGKTLFARAIAKLIDVPFAIADATSLTEAGYVGDDVESIITRLLQAANNDVGKAEKGIVYIDEIDKKARHGDTASGTKDVSGEGVQQSLLKILEGSDVYVPSSGNRRNPMQELTKIDTTSILFICGGAFVGLEEIVRKAQKKGMGTIGFGASVETSKEKAHDLLTKVEPEHLASFGLIPELIGRLPVVAALDELDEDQLMRVLVEPKNAVTKQFSKLFGMDDIALEFEEEALRAMAKLSVSKKTGARGLRGVLEKKLSKLQFDLPDLRDGGVDKIIITKDTILDGSTPIMTYK